MRITPAPISWGVCEACSAARMSCALDMPSIKDVEKLLGEA